MECPACGAPLTWCADHNFADLMEEGQGICSDYSCPQCQTRVRVLTPAEVAE